MYKGCTQITPQGIAQESEILLPDGQIEPQSFDQRQPFGGADLRWNKQLNRIPNAIDGKENGNRNGEQHQSALDQALQSICSHHILPE